MKLILSQHRSRWICQYGFMRQRQPEFPVKSLARVLRCLSQWWVCRVETPADMPATVSALLIDNRVMEEFTEKAAHGLAQEVSESGYGWIANLMGVDLLNSRKPDADRAIQRSLVSEVWNASGGSAGARSIATMLYLMQTDCPQTANQPQTRTTRPSVGLPSTYAWAFAASASGKVRSMSTSSPPLAACANIWETV